MMAYKFLGWAAGEQGIFLYLLYLKKKKKWNGIEKERKGKERKGKEGK